MLLLLGSRQPGPLRPRAGLLHLRRPVRRVRRHLSLRDVGAAAADGDVLEARLANSCPAAPPIWRATSRVLGADSRPISSSTASSGGAAGCAGAAHWLHHVGLPDRPRPSPFPWCSAGSTFETEPGRPEHGIASTSSASQQVAFPFDSLFGLHDLSRPGLVVAAGRGRRVAGDAAAAARPRGGGPATASARTSCR